MKKRSREYVLHKVVCRVLSNPCRYNLRLGEYLEVVLRYLRGDSKVLVMFFSDVYVYHAHHDDYEHPRWMTSLEVVNDRMRAVLLELEKEVRYA